jgi:hypothetical protein
VSGLRVDVSTPGQITLSWRLVHASDIAHVFVNRGPADHCPTAPAEVNPGLYAGTQIGPVSPRSSQVDTSPRDTKRYCYAVFTLDTAGNWASPVIKLARNPGDTTPPAPVTDVTVAAIGPHGVTVAWTNAGGATSIAVIRGAAGGACPAKPAEGTRIGGPGMRSSQRDSGAKPGTAYCYAVFAYDQARNRSDVATGDITVPAQPKPTSPTAESGSAGGSSLTTVVGIIGGGAIAMAGLAFVALRLARREWEWHMRTGYGIRDLMSIEVRGYDRSALLIPAVIGVCIAGALVLLLHSL